MGAVVAHPLRRVRGFLAISGTGDLSRQGLSDLFTCGITPRGQVNVRRIVKLIDQIDSQKLRGGFYTPDAVVDACLERVSLLLNGNPEVRVLEPSAGDGAFVRGLARTRGLVRRSHMTCVESLDAEAQACREELERTRVAGEVITDSFFHWLRGQRGPFNVTIGSPLFIR